MTHQIQITLKEDGNAQNITSLTPCLSNVVYLGGLYFTL